MQKLHTITFLALMFFVPFLRGAEEDEVKQFTTSYVEAFNKKDAKEMARHWAEDAQYTNPFTGVSVQGREEIEEQLLGIMQEGGEAKVTLAIESVDFPENGKAVERGKATLKREGNPDKETFFQVTLSKQGGEWKIRKIDEVDWVEVPSHYQELKDLEWLIGNWVDRSDTFELDSSFQWDKYKNFIVHHFTMKVFGKIDLEGEQIIGWDPIHEQVRSWMFDSDGGFAEGTWKKEGKSWVVSTLSTLPEGRKGSQVVIMTPEDRNSYLFEITDREVDGEMLPNIDPVKIFRKGGGI